MQSAKFRLHNFCVILCYCLQIIAVDARNHGDSPHTYAFSYDHLCADTVKIMKDLKLQNATLMGHSMGGRAMMLVALKYVRLKLF